MRPSSCEHVVGLEFENCHFNLHIWVLFIPTPRLHAHIPARLRSPDWESIVVMRASSTVQLGPASLDFDHVLTSHDASAKCIEYVFV